MITSNANSMAERFAYNGKENNPELGIEWYDFGARNYDASLGRWMNIDPLSEQYSTTSPYVYTINNPIFFVDPDGRKVRNADEERKQEAEKERKKFQDNVDSAEKNYGISRSDFNSRSDYKRYQKQKRKLAKAERDVEKFTSRSQSTQTKIDEFKKNSPNMFAVMDNLQNEYGENVDVMVSTEDLHDEVGLTENAYKEDDDNTETRVSSNTSYNGYKGNQINTISVKINTTMIKSYRGTTPTTLQAVRHEMGHAYYTVTNTQSYYEYIKSKNYQSHRRDDPSARMAELWEDINDLPE